MIAENPTLATVTVVAAFLTASVSFIGLIISKEQKVSDFRQAWIDALRKDLALLIAHVDAIYDHRHAQQATDSLSEVEAWQAARADYVGANKAMASIQLRLNPDECESKAVKSCARRLIKMLLPNKPLPEPSDILEVQEELVENAHCLLKNEWNRVKKGEWIYRIAKWVALALGVITIGLVFALVWMLV